MRPEAEGEWASALVEHSSDVIVVVNEAGVVLFGNPAASLTFGVALEEAIGKSAFSYVHPDDRERVIAKLADLAEQPSGTMRTTKIRFISEVTGEVRTLEAVSTNCLDVPGVRGIVVNGRDVTQRDEYMTKLESSFDAITNTVANMVELLDANTAGHQRRVAQIAGAIARELSMPEPDVKGIEVAAMLHDIGKIAIPIEILTRPGKLSDAEFDIVKTHSEAGWKIVSGIDFPWPVAQMISQHHERLDGSGYPHHFRGEEIGLGGRILAVADVVVAISSHRPYRPALGLESALNYLEANRGTRFDRDAVDACLRLYRDETLPPEKSTVDGNDKRVAIKLTPREWEVLRLLLQGVRVPVISEKLEVTRSTVRNHLATIFQKFGVHSQSELIELFRDRAPINGEHDGQSEVAS